MMQGREILQSTVDLVQNNLNLEVFSYIFLSSFPISVTKARRLLFHALSCT